MENQQNNFLIYNTANNKVSVDVIVQDETVWLSQKGMGELFGVTKKTVSEHLGNIFDSKELKREATVRNIQTVQRESKSKDFRNI